jgi:SAM-dependent methyltransferase
MLKIPSRIISDPFKKPFWRAAIKIRHFGLRRYCPICRSWLRSFEPFGLGPRLDALCPVCGSLERHRLVWVFFNCRTNLLDGSPKKMLHIAPEKEFDAKLRKTRGLDYLTADLHDPYAMVQMDITNIDYPGDFFGVIYCSHVLEHVGDDRKAMREVKRVLKSDGWAVFVVPIRIEKTIEDPSVTDSGERERLFGQHDHVRRYGRDFVNRLEEVGFSVTTFSSADIVSAGNIVRFGLKDEQLFFCTKKP